MIIRDIYMDSCPELITSTICFQQFFSSKQSGHPGCSIYLAVCISVTAFINHHDMDMDPESRTLSLALAL